MERCAECGSWGEECVNDKPVAGCGCARCLREENAQLRTSKAEVWRELDVAKTTLAKMRNEANRIVELERVLAPLIHRHCGLCVPVDEQGRMGAVTTESCVCAPHHKQARAALVAERGGER